MPLGGGGTPCKICDKTVYPAETVQFEKTIYHADCFKCTDCSKKITPAGAAQFDDKVYCHMCFKKNNFSQKQTKQTWVAKEAPAGEVKKSRFGGGGNPCKICTKTVYPAETVLFEKMVFHQDCFKCSLCETKITVSNANQFEGAVICKKCFKSNGYTQKQVKTAAGTGTGTSSSSGKMSKFGGGGNPCKVCAKTVYSAETVSFEKQVYHADCFKCQNCSKKLTPSGAEGKKQDDGDVDVYCKKCWGELGLNRADVKK